MFASIELQHGALLVEYRASPYLRDDISQNFERDKNDGNLEDTVPFVMMPMRRSSSLNFVSTDISETPCMLRMPPRRQFADITETLKIIPRKSWLLPYVIACCPLHVFEGLLKLPFLVTEDDDGEGGGGGLLSYSTVDSCSNHDQHPMECTSHNINNHYPSQSQDSSCGNSSKQAPDISVVNNSSSSTVRTHQDILTVSCDSSSTERRHRSLSDLATFQDAYDEFHPFAPPHIYGHGGGIGRKTSPPVLSFTRPITFPDSWRSLGVLLLSSDPSWCKWEPKIVFLLDTYLIECVNSTTAFSIIGYIQLSDSQIEKTAFQNESFKRFIPTPPDQYHQQQQQQLFRSQPTSPRIGGEVTGVGIADQTSAAMTSSQPIVDSTGVTSSSYAIKISGYKISSNSSPCEMHTFYLTTIQCFTQEGKLICMLLLYRHH